MSKIFQPGVALRGMAMGMAEVVPGVSGGTIAFITGIYERLLAAIKSVDGTFFKHLFSLKLAAAFKHIDGLFLVSLLMGMVIGIVGAVFSVTYLLDHYPPAVWAFFFGLIIASTIYISKQVPKWDVLHVALVALFTVVAFLIVQAVPSEGSTSYPYVFISGMIAISALMLPGISGSFILLLMGMYKYITGTLKGLMTDFSTDSLFTLIVFGLGLLTGMAVFSRVLTWTFKKYHSQTLAALSGFMIGSLWKIWPWRIPTSWMTDDGTIVDGTTAALPTNLHDVKILSELNVLPAEYTMGPSLLVPAVLAAIVGFTIVFLMERMTKN